MNMSIDTERFTAAGLAFETIGQEGVFRLLIEGAPAPDVLVRVPLNGEGTELVFFPQRSAAQRQVLDRLGVTYPAP